MRQQRQQQRHRHHPPQSWDTILAHWENRAKRENIPPAEFFAFLDQFGALRMDPLNVHPRDGEEVPPTLTTPPVASHAAIQLFRHALQYQRSLQSSRRDEISMNEALRTLIEEEITQPLFGLETVLTILHSDGGGGGGGGGASALSTSSTATTPSPPPFILMQRSAIARDPQLEKLHRQLVEETGEFDFRTMWGLRPVVAATTTTTTAGDDDSDEKQPAIQHVLHVLFTLSDTIPSSVRNMINATELRWRTASSSFSTETIPILSLCCVAHCLANVGRHFSSDGKQQQQQQQQHRKKSSERWLWWDAYLKTMQVILEEVCVPLPPLPPRDRDQIKKRKGASQIVSLSSSSSSSWDVVWKSKKVRAALREFVRFVVVSGRKDGAEVARRRIGAFAADAAVPATTMTTQQNTFRQMNRALISQQQQQQKKSAVVDNVDDDDEESWWWSQMALAAPSTSSSGGDVESARVRRKRLYQQRVHLRMRDAEPQITRGPPNAAVREMCVSVLEGLSHIAGVQGVREDCDIGFIRFACARYYAKLRVFRAGWMRHPLRDEIPRLSRIGAAMFAPKVFVVAMQDAARQAFWMAHGITRDEAMFFMRLFVSAIAAASSRDMLYVVTDPHTQCAASVGNALVYMFLGLVMVGTGDRGSIVLGAPTSAYRNMCRKLPLSVVALVGLLPHSNKRQRRKDLHVMMPDGPIYMVALVHGLTAEDLEMRGASSLLKDNERTTQHDCARARMISVDPHAARDRERARRLCVTRAREQHLFTHKAKKHGKKKKEASDGDDEEKKEDGEDGENVDTLQIIARGEKVAELEVQRLAIDPTMSVITPQMTNAMHRLREWRDMRKQFASSSSSATTTATVVDGETFHHLACETPWAKVVWSRHRTTTTNTVRNGDDVDDDDSDVDGVDGVDGVEEGQKEESALALVPMHVRCVMAVDVPCMHVDNVDFNEACHVGFVATLWALMLAHLTLMDPEEVSEAAPAEAVQCADDVIARSAQSTFYELRNTLVVQNEVLSSTTSTTATSVLAWNPRMRRAIHAVMARLCLVPGEFVLAPPPSLLPDSRRDSDDEDDVDDSPRGQRQPLIDWVLLPTCVVGPRSPHPMHTARDLLRIVSPEEHWQ